jgi:hypothetical protein
MSKPAPMHAVIEGEPVRVVVDIAISRARSVTMTRDTDS